KKKKNKKMNKTNKDLTERRKIWDPNGSQLSDLVEQFVPYFRMYQQFSYFVLLDFDEIRNEIPDCKCVNRYMNNYDKAITLMRKLESKQKVAFIFYFFYFIFNF
ncbi:hypothetical protein RFI_33692, partial [Reticulomyxa filosa]